MSRPTGGCNGGIPREVGVVPQRMVPMRVWAIDRVRSRRQNRGPDEAARLLDEGHDGRHSHGIDGRHLAGGRPIDAVW